MMKGGNLDVKYAWLVCNITARFYMQEIGCYMSGTSGNQPDAYRKVQGSVFAHLSEQKHTNKKA